MCKNSKVFAAKGFFVDNIDEVQGQIVSTILDKFMFIGIN